MADRSEARQRGDRIRRARRLKDLTQQDVSAALKISVQSVSQWETGRTRPNADRLRELAEMLGVDAEWIMADKGQPILGSSTVAGISAADVIACLTAYVREHGKREGLLDALLPPERQEEGIARALGLIEYLGREE